MKKSFKITIALITLMSLLFSFTVSADSFTHKNNENGSVSAALSRNTYVSIKNLNASSLGLDKKMDGITDIYCSNKGLTYILCSKESEIVILDSNYSLLDKIVIKDSNDAKVSFEEAQGLYVDNENIYIADTAGSRIIISDLKGNMISLLECPKSDLIPEGFVFQPTQLVKDDDGYLFVISSGCYYGMLTFSNNTEFMGFYGANRVSATTLDTFSYLFDLITSNDTKKSFSKKKLPYSFIDLSIDNQGYITACTGKTEKYNNGSGQIRKLSPTGVNIILRHNADGSSSSADSFNFLEDAIVTKFGSARTQNIVAIECSKDGFIYSLDETYGLIYIYDTNCNLLNAFGGGVGEGNQLGKFSDAVSFALNGNDLVVADAKNCSISVFTRSEYGSLYFEAQNMYLQGDYEIARPLWEQVLKLDSSNQMAYRGLAMAEYNKGDYKKAAQYAESGLDYVTYDLAHREILNSFIMNYFTFIFVGIILIVVILFVLLRFRKKKRTKSSAKNLKLQALKGVISHPFLSYSDIKYKNQGSLLYATIIVLLFFFANALQSTATGFLFRHQSAETYNVFYSILQTIGLVVLWTISNWLVCTLFSGKGTMKEIYVSTSYALVPMIAFLLIKVLLSHFLPLSGAGILNGIYVVVLIYTFYLLTVAIMTVHEYSFSKFILTSIVTVLGMILVVFIIFMLIVLLQQFWNLVYSVYMEAISI